MRHTTSTHPRTPCQEEGIASLIVCLEDNEDDSFLLRHALKGVGLADHMKVVSTAPAAREFLGRLSEAPGLIICDLGFAGTCGLDMLDWVRRQPHLAEVPVLLISGALTSSQRNRARTLGVEACFEKTGDWRELAGHIRQLLESRQARE